MGSTLIDFDNFLQTGVGIAFDVTMCSSFIFILLHSNTIFNSSTILLVSHKNCTQV